MGWPGWDTGQVKQHFGICKLGCDMGQLKNIWYIRGMQSTLALQRDAISLSQPANCPGTPDMNQIQHQQGDLSSQMCDCQINLNGTVSQTF